MIRYPRGALLLLCLFASPSLANDLNPEQTIQLARRLYSEGTRLYKAKKYQRSARMFQKAIDFLKNAENRPSTQPKTRARFRRSRGVFTYILGRVYQSQKRFKKASETYRQALQLKPGPAISRKIQALLSQVNARIRVDVSIFSTPSGAKVHWTDSEGGVHVAQTPFRSKLAPGRSSLRITKPGHRSVRASIDLKPGSAYVKSFTLARLAPGARPPAPPVRAKVAIAWGLLGLAIAAGGTSVLLFALSQNDVQQFNQKLGSNNATSQAVKAHYDQAAGMQIGALVGLGVAGVAATVSIILFASPK